MAWHPFKLAAMVKDLINSLKNEQDQGHTIATEKRVQLHLHKESKDCHGNQSIAPDCSSAMESRRFSIEPSIERTFSMPPCCAIGFSG